jgi:hypothetical protein
MYKQCQVQYQTKAISVVWIPIEFAIPGKRIIVGKNSLTGIPAKIQRVYDVQLTRAEIESNRKVVFDSIKEV